MLLAHDDLDRALEHLVSLQEGDRGVLEVLTFGPRAISRLRELLFRREPSGLYQSRCRVVEALAALGGKDVLIAFLNLDREIKEQNENVENLKKKQQYLDTTFKNAQSHINEILGHR